MADSKDIEKVEFEFPDEKADAEAKVNDEEIKAEGDGDIEIVDDTPPADRGRKPSDEPPREFSDDELAKYDESVKNRIRHFTKGYHEERILLEQLKKRITGMIEYPSLEKVLHLVPHRGPMDAKVLGKSVDVHACARTRNEIPQQAKTEIVL